MLKCTHDSGGLIICKDKKNFDIEAARKKINACLKVNYYYKWREWPYKDVKPRILAEKYVKDDSYDVLPVYKIMCFEGEPRIIQTIQNDKQVNESIDYFDVEWNLLNLKQNFPNSKIPYQRPKKLNEMLDIARVLSEGTHFLRVDLYVMNEKIAFSEYTFYSDAGISKFEPEEWDHILGGWVRLAD